MTWLPAEPANYHRNRDRASPSSTVRHDLVIKAVISPRQTRRRLAEAFAAAPAGRGQHGNIPL